MLTTLDFVKRMNSLESENRMEGEWEYVLLGENHFYELSANNPFLDEICALAKVTLAGVEGVLFS